MSDPLKNLSIKVAYPQGSDDLSAGSHYRTQLQMAVTAIITAVNQGENFAPHDPKLLLLQNQVWGADPDPRFPFPLVVFAQDEVRFDEVTEVKYGGTQGVLLRFSDGDTLATVRPQMRGYGIGSMMWDEAEGWTTPGISGIWMPTSLSEEQLGFVQKQRLSPHVMSVNGGVRWTNDGAFLDVEE